MSQEWVDALLGRLTLEDKVVLVAGADLWSTPGVAHAAVPPLKVTDGPNGARGGTLPGAGLRAACFPCGASLGASWNAALVREVGEALGDEALSKSAHILLAPTINLHRQPLAGRNFECYSEDPLLSARLAVAFVTGVQSRGVAACVKHFVCNDSEFQRQTISSEVGERALREIYLLPFEAAVCEGGAWAVMGAYNRVNGTYMCEHPRLLREILKGEWGFDGVVMSDWFATPSAGALAAGLDLEMPGPPRRFGAELLDALRGGDAPTDALDDAVRRLLRLRERTRAAELPADAPEQAIDRPAHRELARRAARESIVLLRNEGTVLPLERGALRRLAVIGPNADVAVIQGGGSAQVTPHYAVTPLDGIRELAGPDVEVRFERGCTNHQEMPVLDERWLAGPLEVAFFGSDSFDGAPLHRQDSRRAEYTWLGPPAPGVPSDRFSARITAVLVAPESGEYTWSITRVGRARMLVNGRVVVDAWGEQPRGSSFFGTGSAPLAGRARLAAGERVDLEVQFTKERADVALSGVRLGCLRPDPPDAIERAVACAREADAAVVVVGLTPEWETEGRDRIDMELPGRQVELVQRVASVNPRTIAVLNAGSPLALERLAAVPALLQLGYPGQECGRALADVLFGDVDPGGRLPTTFPRRLEDNPAYLNYPGENGRVLYGEGVFVGYRYYDAVDRDPLFPFGHGLSYTRFEYTDLRLAAAEIGVGDTANVSLDVRNVGPRRGTEVAQLYVHDVESRLSRPPQELAAFAKVELAPGEKRTVELALGPRAFSYYDPELPGWVAEPGEFELRVGASSRDIRARARLVLKG